MAITIVPLFHGGASPPGDDSMDFNNSIAKYSFAPVLIPILVHTRLKPLSRGGCGCEYGSLDHVIDQRYRRSCPSARLRGLGTHGHWEAWDLSDAARRPFYTARSPLNDASIRIAVGIIGVIVRVEIVIGVVWITKAVEAEVEKVPVKAPKVMASPAKPAAFEATEAPRTRKPSIRKPVRPAESRTKAASADKSGGSAKAMAATPAATGQT